ncbi:MAG: FtsQ-type POTRA domain-containing protein [Rhodospirillaceae bacterium]|nr:MAG: FtsQ-type POTRA domain-containing protein [Rhodospirillaceae bacterium]
MRRLTPRDALIRRLAPWGAAGLASVALATILTVSAVKYAPPPPALVPMRDAAVRNFVRFTAMAGLRLETLTVEGRDRTTPDDLLAALDVARGSPILTIDLTEARTAIETLPWVKAARVERQLPDTVHVVIQERQPFALWQQGGRYTLVDQDGTAIVAVPSADPSLRVIVGPDAPANAAALFADIDKVPELGSRVRAAVRVGARRWNVYFDSFENGIAVRLPEDDVPGAWARLASLEHDYKILERDLEFIDLRLPDRLIVRIRKTSAEEPQKQAGKTIPSGALMKTSGPKQTHE